MGLVASNVVWTGVLEPQALAGGHGSSLSGGRCGLWLGVWFVLHGWCHGWSLGMGLGLR